MLGDPGGAQLAQPALRLCGAVEYNLFIKCRGENEGMVCNKSCDNVYRYNTITDGTRELSLRATATAAWSTAIIS